MFDSIGMTDPSRRCHRPRAGRALAASGGVLTLVAACATAPGHLGPMPVRNQHPAQLTVMHLPPAGAIPGPAGQVRVRWANGYSSMFLGGADARAQLDLDGESLRSELGARWEIGHGLEAGGAIAAGYASGGFLDGFVIDFHDLFGLPDQNRHAAPRGDYVVEVRDAGSTVFHLEDDTVQLADLPLWLRWTPLQGRVGAAEWALGARGGIELPTGNADLGFGNGRTDAALGVLGELRYGVLGATAHVQHAFAGVPRRSRADGFELRDVTSAGGGIELACVDGVWLLVQTEWETSTLRGVDLSRVADDQWLIWGGLRTAVGDATTIEIGLGEDLSSFVSPDFTLWFELETRF